MDTHPHLDERIPEEERRGFHSREGFFFKREPDGSVTIRVEGPPWENGRGQLQREITLPENEWASVVASVSALSEDGVTWAVARAFHAGEPLAVRA